MKFMKKWTKSVLVTVLSAVFLLGCMGTAWANLTKDQTTDFTTGPSSGATVEAGEGIDSFKLIKDYDSQNPTSAAPFSSSPAETFTFTIAPYAVWNAGTGITANTMPMLQNAANSTATAAGSNLTVTVVTTKGDAAVPASPESHTDDKNATVYLPTYDTVGDYWYKVDETPGSTIGVVYNSHSYYIHVQVTQVGSDKVSNVTMHDACPDPATVTTSAAYATAGKGNKLQAIENMYNAGKLTVTKVMTGSGGDQTKYFPVTVVFTKPSGTIVNSDITFSARLSADASTDSNVTIQGQHYSESPNDTNIVWKITGGTQASDSTTEALTATATFFVKHGTEVTFSNIPYDITYTVQETLDSNDGYTNSYAFDSDANIEAGESVTGTIASGRVSDASDVLTITNSKATTIDIGVITENAPYIALLAVSGAVLFLLVSRKKKLSEV